MINFTVPTGTPLTHSDNAIEVFLIQDEDVFHGPGGVYPNVNRAIAYIQDWLDAGLGEDEESIPLTTKLNGDDILIFQDETCLYRIVSTYFRL